MKLLSQQFLDRSPFVSRLNNDFNQPYNTTDLFSFG